MVFPTPHIEADDTDLGNVIQTCKDSILVRPGLEGAIRLTICVGDHRYATQCARAGAVMVQTLASRYANWLVGLRHPIRLSFLTSTRR